MHRSLLAAAGAAGACTALCLPASAAHADGTAPDQTQVVAGLPSADSDTYVSYFGCVDLFHADTRGPAITIVVDPAAPAGQRSTDITLPGTGTAAGQVSIFDSVAAATQQFSIKAPEGGAGVAWVWYVAPGLDPGQAWAGRADLQAGPGWQRVAPDAASYAWHRVDATTGEVVEDAGSATIHDFTAVHGDGPGYVLGGFGCDGHGFALDALTAGDPGAVTTYDLEGIPVTTTISASALRLQAGDPVTLTGATVDAQQHPMGPALVLQQRPVGGPDFTDVGAPVAPNAEGRSAATVVPETTTDYRWYFPGAGYADAGWSDTIRVVVAGDTAK